MDAIEPKSLKFDVKLSESLVFTPPTRVRIYESISEEWCFQGRISPNERLETIRDFLNYIQREFQISSPICLYGPNGITFKNSEGVNTLPKHSTLLVGPPDSAKTILTPTLSQRVPLLKCSASAISTELNASSDTTLASVVSNLIERNVSTTEASAVADSDSEVDDTISNSYEDDNEETLETANTRKSIPVSGATSMSFADWEFLDVQRRLKSFMNETNIEGRHKLKEWFLEFYETFEPKGLVSASACATSRVPCSPVDPNEIEISMVSETNLIDPDSQTQPTAAEATPPFPPTANEPTYNSDSDQLVDDTDSGSNVEDSTSTYEENEDSRSHLEKTGFYEGNNISTTSIDNSETASGPHQSSEQGSNCGILRRSQRAKSQSSRCQNLPLETETVIDKAKQTWHRCSHSSCSFKTRGPVFLKMHLAKVHFETPFKCSTCGQEYRSYNSFYYHSKTHEEKKHVCPFQNCSYKSVNSSHLKEHMMIHIGDKPFTCKECDYRCGRKNHLKRHVNNRHGVKK